MTSFSKELGALFIHVPKTAGTSMEALSFLGGSGHTPLSIAVGNIKREYPALSVDSIFKFAFVRHPLDRFVSCFFHKQYPQIECWGYGCDKRGFTEFVYMAHAVGLKPLLMYPEPGNWHLHHHFLPQWFFICDEEKRIGVDFVGRFHCLDLDWRVACARMGIEYVPLPHLKSSQHEPFTYYYTPETERMVLEMYREDLEIFGGFF